MKKLLLVLLGLLCLCGCNDKNVPRKKYEKLEKKYNELAEKYDTSKEENYLNEYLSSNYNVQASKIGKYSVLELYLDVSNGADPGISGLAYLIDEDWFDYDYVFLIGYYNGNVAGITQIDGKTGLTLKTFKDTIQ